MSWRPNLIHHSHSGKLRPHEYTSYIPLLILLAITGFCLSVYTTYAVSPGPQAGSVGISGTVLGTPPATAATIAKPTNGAAFAQPLIDIGGMCEKGTIVYVYRNDIFAGSTPCLENGTYTTQIDLFPGENTIFVRIFNMADQEGPLSLVLKVTYNPTSVQSTNLSLIDFSQQLILNTDAVFKGTFPKQNLSLPLTILGGTAPFGFNIWWGDSSNEVAVHETSDVLRLSHTYARAGTYQITIQGKDAAERTAFLSVAAIVNGDPNTALSSSSTTGSDNSIAMQLLALWPVYVGLIVVVLSFWFGEWRERRVLEHSARIAI